MNKPTEEITKEKFQAYEAVRKSGATNMFDVKTVMMLSGLERAEIIAIMENYTALKEEFNKEEGKEKESEKEREEAKEEIENAKEEDDLQERIDRDED